MAKIFGQIESLSKIRKTLDDNYIFRFNSIKDLNNFNKNYNYLVEDIFVNEEINFNNEVLDFEKQIVTVKEYYDYAFQKKNDEIDSTLYKLKAKVEIIKNKSNKTLLYKWINIFRDIVIRYKFNSLKRNKKLLLIEETKDLKFDLDKKLYNLEQHLVNKEFTLRERTAPKIDELKRVKKVVDSLNTLILGAIGERNVENELKRLPNNYTIINNFTSNFNPPIYNKLNKDKIFSIQIDHVVVSKSGVFVLETKNWSKKSIESLDLRSPIEQIKRTSYAMFNLCNSDYSKNKPRLNYHHWGNKKIPIRNVIVIINHRPKEKFKHVAIKTLKELNKYINYFDPILSDLEVEEIAEYLQRFNTSK